MDLPWNKLACITADGELALTGKYVDLHRLVNDKVKINIQAINSSLFTGKAFTKHVCHIIVKVVTPM
jgi:hypothetical protein